MQPPAIRPGGEARDRGRTAQSFRARGYSKVILICSARLYTARRSVRGICTYRVYCEVWRGGSRRHGERLGLERLLWLHEAVLRGDELQLILVELTGRTHDLKVCAGGVLEGLSRRTPLEQPSKEEATREVADAHLGGGEGENDGGGEREREGEGEGEGKSPAAS